MSNGDMPGEVQLQPEVAEVLQRLDALGLRQKDLADALDLDPTKISRVRSGERLLKGAEMLKALAWLEAQERAAAAKAPDIPPTRLASADDDMAEVLAVDLSFSMGPGTTIDDYVEETPVKFDLGFLRTYTMTPPARLRLGRGIGDSMFPTIHDSDLVLFDTAQRVLNMQDKIWAISIYGAAAVKRLRAVGNGRVLLISDNPSIDNQEVDAEDLIIAGRVVASIRKH